MRASEREREREREIEKREQVIGTLSIMTQQVSMPLTWYT